jgi:hypothetical protein
MSLRIHNCIFSPKNSYVGQLPPELPPVVEPSISKGNFVLNASTALVRKNGWSLKSNWGMSKGSSSWANDGGVMVITMVIASAKA